MEGMKRAPAILLVGLMACTGGRIEGGRTIDTVTSPVTGPSTAPSPSVVGPTIGPSPTAAPERGHGAVDETKDVSFVDPAHGWALVWRTDRASHASRLRGVYKTSDGGHTWHVVGRPTASPVVTHLQLSTRNDGFAFGPDLFVTHDGGNEWRRIDVDRTVLDLQAVGASVWMLVGRCFEGATGPGGCHHARLERSTDAGRTWSSPERVLPVGEDEELNADPDEQQLSLVRAGSRAGWIVSASGGDPDLPSPLLGTSDGGSVWSPLRNPCSRKVPAAGGFTGPLTFEEHISAIDPRRLWMVCTDEPALGQADRVLYRSADGGRHWRRAASRCCSGNELHIAAISWRKGWETDGTAAYALARIIVGRGIGNYVIADKAPWVSLKFLTRRFGWAAMSTNVLYRTTDAGRHWRMHPIQPAP